MPPIRKVSSRSGSGRHPRFSPELKRRAQECRLCPTAVRRPRLRIVGFQIVCRLARLEQLVALYPHPPKAEALAANCVPMVYDDAESSSAARRLDSSTMSPTSGLTPTSCGSAAKHGVPSSARSRWPRNYPPPAHGRDLPQGRRALHGSRELAMQHPIREVSEAMAEGGVGRPFRARIRISTTFPSLTTSRS